MITGHFGLASAVKAHERWVPLWALMLSSVWLDVIFIPLFAANVETISDAPGTKGGYGDSIIHADYTHSLLGAVLIALVTGQLIGLSPANALPPADLLRINLARPPVQGTEANRLGALAGDEGGFPNGRRLTDDVVDIELQVLAGALLDEGDGEIGESGVPYAAIGDGVDASDRPPLSTFPYQGTPVSGYDQDGQPS